MNKDVNVEEKLKRFAEKVEELTIAFWTYDQIGMSEGYFISSVNIFENEKNFSKKIIFISLIQKFYLDIAKFFDRDTRTLSIHDLIYSIPDNKIKCEIFCAYENKVKSYENNIKSLMSIRNKLLAHNEKFVLFGKREFIAPNDIVLSRDIIEKILVWLVDKIYCSLIEKKILNTKKPEFFRQVDEIEKRVKNDFSDLSFKNNFIVDSVSLT